ncbi:MAG: hypothetical protein LBH98_03355 [Chitinispirillales bacterium]|nr:hypothetical protein [Chitinispirillales bacterium]
MRIKFLLFTLVFAGVCFCGFPTVLVQYRNGGSEIIKKADISDISGKPYFRTKGRNVEINIKRLHYIDIFSDTVEIYHSNTWCRTDIYPLTKDTIPVVYHGWMKISTILCGVADFGKLSASISELKQIHFKPKEILRKTEQSSDTTEVFDTDMQPIEIESLDEDENVQ